MAIINVTPNTGSITEVTAKLRDVIVFDGLGEVRLNGYTIITAFNENKTSFYVEKSGRYDTNLGSIYIKVNGFSTDGDDIRKAIGSNYNHPDNYVTFKDNKGGGEGGNVEIPPELKMQGLTRFGKISLPSDFKHNLDFDLWRDASGNVVHNFNMDDRIKGFKEYFVSDSGSSANDGLTSAKPRANLTQLIKDIEADVSVTSAKINILGGVLTKDNAVVQTSTLITKDIAIINGEPSKPCYVGTINKGTAWTLHEGTTYKATRSVTSTLFDTAVPSEFNLPFKMKKVNSIVECTNTKGSWFTDGTSVYVNRINGSVPDISVMVCLDSPAWLFRFNADCNIYLKGITMLSGSTAEPLNFSAVTTSKGKAYLSNVAVANSMGSANGISSTGVKSIWSFNCIIKDPARDGYNYHNIIDRDTFAFEYNCIAFNCGMGNSEGNNNATTGHEGIRLLRVGTKGWNTTGPVCADVNGCYSIVIDCSMMDSTRTADPTKTAYWFDDLVSAINPTPNGKAIMYNCQGGGVNTFGVNVGDTFNLPGKLIVSNFKGKNIPSTLKYTLVD